MGLLGVTAAVVLAVAMSSASSAMGAEAPAWNVVAISTPTNLRPGSPANEVQTITVNATGGTFTLTLSAQSVNGNCGGSSFSKEETTGAIAYNASAAQVEAALGALECMKSQGASATVTGAAGGPYQVTFGGSLGNAPVSLMKASSSSLTGGSASATVTESTKGARVPRLLVTATNVGGAGTSGSTITLSDALPPGVTATSVSGYDMYRNGVAENGFGFMGVAMSCSAPPVVSCTFSEAVEPGDTLGIVAELNVASSVAIGEAPNRASVSGGGAASASSSNPLTVGTTPAAFGPAPGSVMIATSSNQAGAHANVTTAFTLSTEEVFTPPANPRDVRFDLPRGVVANTVGIPRCKMTAVMEQLGNVNACPADSMVGMATVTIAEAGSKILSLATAVYNIAPAPGEPAAFAFNAYLFPVRLDTSVLSDGNYAARVTVGNLTESAIALGTSLTMWGVPADHSGPGKGMTFFNLFDGSGSFGGPSPSQTRMLLLTNPQQCGEPLSTVMSADSWLARGVFEREEAPMGSLVGCEALDFESSFTMLPDTLAAGAPAGYSLDLNVPQNADPSGLATPDVKNVTLKLPAGTVVNPSAAWGLKACSDAQFALHSGRTAECPREAQVGTVRIKTPALEEALEGQVYLGEPSCDPCTPEDAADGRMIRLFLNVVGEGESGIVVKLEGHGRIDQRTGQITTTFEENPQLPFSEFKLTLGGGPRAVLANPRTCGPATTAMDLAPWSTPFTPDSTPSYTFEVNQDCFGPRFNPSFVAGSTNIQAGAHGEFTLAFGRSDHDQYLKQITMHMPPGLLGTLAGVELCKEAQANAGACGANSLLGSAQVLTGPGANPFLVEGGRVYLTEGYGGAPYGLSIVVPAVAGPYTLSGTTGQGTVVVRSQIFIDPVTAQLTAVSGDMPSMLDGIPLQLRAVNVRLDRPGFMFNPTSCAKMAITGTIAAVEGMSAAVSSPFQVTNCATLGFKPKFKVSTSARTSRTNGASLDVKLTYPKAPFGSQANIKSVHVELPRALPSRLSTLNHACLDSVFNQNPASCPSQSRVGFAKAVTPVLPVPLEGPAYFVSHGGQRFPELIVVLQGYGVTVYLQGETFISKAGVTSSTFKTVPDVPVGSFELTLPEGPFSALAANTDLCTANLVMPNVFDAQNGAQIKQNTSIEVTGCPYALRIVHRSVSNHTLTLKVSVPQAGKLTATGRGLTSAAKSASGRQTLTLTLKERRAGRLRASVLLRFTPGKGKQRKALRKSTTVTFP